MVSLSHGIKHVCLLSYVICESFIDVDQCFVCTFKAYISNLNSEKCKKPNEIT